MAIDEQISVEDLMKKPQKELLTMIYVQAVITNGTVKRHETDIGYLKKDMKKKISNTVFGIGSGVVAFIILLFQVLDYWKR